MRVRPFAYSSPDRRASPGTRAHTNAHALKKRFPPVPARSHVDCVSIRGQEWLVISLREVTVRMGRLEHSVIQPESGPVQLIQPSCQSQ